jgi:type II secretory pathway pseudopilin PulG
LAIRRSQSGVTLLEMVVSTILIGFSLAVIGELVILNTLASTKLSNKIDGQVGCSRALRRICEDVRQSRIIGNAFATVPNSYPDSATITTDPAAQVTPVGGFPTDWTAPPYLLNAQTLIVQQPVLFEDPTSTTNPLNGFPVRLTKGAIQADPPIPNVSIEYLDTVVYRLIADPNPEAQGQYMLQIARFSGFPLIPGSKLRPRLNPPQTVLKGIIGPMDPLNPGVPAVFQFLRSGRETTPLATPSPLETQSVVGVSINFQVKSPNKNTGANQEIATGHAEAYLKNAKFLRLTND